MYIVINLITKEVDLFTTIKTTSKFTNVPINKLTHSFSRKKQTYFEYLEYQIYKRKPIKELT